MHDAIARAEIAEQALIAERQRREEAETALRPFNHISGETVGVRLRHITDDDMETVYAYFRKYEPIPADREEERGG